MPGVRFNERKEWFDTIRGWKKSSPFIVIEEMDRLLSGKKEDVIVSTGVGQHDVGCATFQVEVSMVDGNQWW